MSKEERFNEKSVLIRCPESIVPLIKRIIRVLDKDKNPKLINLIESLLGYCIKK